jgi:hypothetical protein
MQLSSSNTVLSCAKIMFEREFQAIEKFITEEDKHIFAYWKTIGGRGLTDGLINASSTCNYVNKCLLLLRTYCDKILQYTLTILRYTFSLS